MRKIQSLSGENVKLTRYNWYLLNWCNYKCSYCFAKNAVNKEFSSLANVSDSYKLTLAKLRQVDVPFEVCLAGGEPTLYPHIEELVTELSTNKQLVKVQLFTNLSRSLRYFKKLQESCPKLQITASYHPEFHSADFVQKCVELKINVSVSMMDDPSYWDQIEDVIIDLQNKGVDYSMTILHPIDSFEPHYTEDFWRRFEKYGSEDNMDYLNVEWSDGCAELVEENYILENNMNRFKGYRCIPGSFQIQLDGTISNTCTKEKMGLNLQSKYTTKEVTCPEDVCYGGLLLYPKTLSSD